MERTVTVVDEHGEQWTITEIRRRDWDGVDGACPRCDGVRYRHFVARGGRVSSRDGVLEQRSDYWDAKRPLATRCLSCDRLLYKHPAFDLLFAGEDDATRVFEG
jgi:hypothetical protein